ncbi:Multiple sugar-binding protein precursor [compost metagenome]
MKNNQRRLLAVKKILISLIMASALTSCFSGKGTESNDDALPVKMIKLSFVYSGSDPALSQVTQEIVDAFNASRSDIQIQALPSSSGVTSYEDYLQTLDAVGEFPDFLELKEPEPYIKAGAITPIPDEVAELLDRPARFDGKVYTAQMASSLPAVIYYNKDVFKKAGITKEPETWSEFLAICARIKDAGISPILVGGRDIWHLGYWAGFFFGTSMYADNPDWNLDATAGRVHFTDEGIVRAMLDLQELWTNKYVNPGWLYTTDSDTATQLVNGNAGMLYTGPEMLKTIFRTNSDDNIGLFALPDREGRIVITGSDRLQGIALTTEAGKDPGKRSAFIAFMKFFYSPQQYTSYVETGIAVPVTKSRIVYETEKLAEELIAISQDPHTVKVQQMDEYWGEGAAPKGFIDWFLSMLQYTLATGRPTVEQLLEQSNEQWTKEVFLDE